MIKFKNVLFLLLFAGIGFTSVAQDPENDEISELIDCNIIGTLNYDFSNFSFLKQSGNDNIAKTVQQQDGLVTNYYVLNQNGTGNNAYLNQEGSAHVTQIWQSGQYNEVNSWSVGSATLTGIKQDGDANRINSYIDNQKVLPKLAVLQQTGNYNKIDLALLGNGFWNESFPKVADIKQTGNHLEFNAIMESYNCPILVEQQSGTSGEGMTVTISNSAFNFPTK